jgi:hypothetical protein
MGFISNSSSSSFIVRRYAGWDFEPKKALTTVAQEKKLKKYGFRKTVAYCTDQLPPFYDEKAWKKEQKCVAKLSPQGDYSYGYEVICNQDEVLKFLIKNKISFAAACHYGHYTVIYDAKKDKVYEGVNFGLIMEMYGTDENFLEIYKTPIRISTGNEWRTEHNI